jgi:DNA topoisomerase-6 subunit B
LATKHAARRPEKKKTQQQSLKLALHGPGKHGGREEKGKAAPGKGKGHAKADKAKPAPKEARKLRESPKTPAPVVEVAVEKKVEKPRPRITAERMGELQREISISEFFTKNRHLLGFDNASRALLTAVKEAVDNSLDACEEAGILPEIKIRIKELAETRYYLSVEDNGPGIVKAQIPKIFGKLLYGSKFHRLRQSRGQQGIGISAAAMYGQLTTGKPIIVTSKTGAGKPAFHYHIIIDTAQNKPVITHEDQFEWAHKDRGTNVELELEAVYKGGKRSLDEFVQLVAVANPHARIEYNAPGKAPVVYPRLREEPPRETKEIKPHPYGVELGILQRMLQGTKSRSLSGFLQAEFSRVSGAVAAEICKNAGLDPEMSVKAVDQTAIEKLYPAIGKTKIMAPPTTCLAPIGELPLLDGLKALLVQKHLAEADAEEAKQRKREGEAEPPPQDKQATLVAEERVAKALETVAEVQPLEEDDEEEEEDERTVVEEAPKTKGKAKSKVAPKAKLVAKAEPPPEPEEEAEEETRAGIIDVFGKPCFVTAVTRNPRVYRGNPFQVEAALAWGGELPQEELATVVRLANRVPLLYQPGACAMTQAVVRANWRTYDVEQARGALPTGPLLVLVHIASVWVPFTSEAKEAVAHYDEIINELKFALQECGRRLSRHIRRRRRAAEAEKKARYIEKYIPHIGIALQDILGLTNSKRDEVVKELTGILERSRKM